tara:strand:- start:377 stop:478 length:102 start_codon:yes stop_codon:yes gene_type:complete
MRKLVTRRTRKSDTKLKKFIPRVERADEKEKGK